MEDTNDTKSVYIIAHEDDERKVDEIVELLEKKSFRCERQCDAHPGTRIVSGLDQKLEEYDTILLVLSKEAGMDGWIHYCQAVMADRKHTVPLIIDPKMEIKDLDPSIQRLVCLKVGDRGYEEKLCDSLRSGGDCCLPVAPIYPGICVNYFYGFLDFVLKDFDKCLKKWEEKQNRATGGSIRVVPKMLIMIPESCECKETLCLYAPDYVKLYPNRPGSTVECAKNPLDASRCYDQHVYEIVNPDDPREKYYAVLVLCATMHALYQMKQDGESGINQEMMVKEREEFEKMLAKLLREHDHCVNKGDVVTFDDNVNKNEEAKAFVRPIIKKCREIMNPQNQ